MVKKIINIILVIILLIGLFFLFDEGVKNQEKLECEKWEIQSQEFNDFYYLTGWQYEQCQHYGFDFVKNVKVVK